MKNRCHRKQRSTGCFKGNDICTETDKSKEEFCDWRWLFHSDWAGKTILSFLDAREALDLSLATVVAVATQKGHSGQYQGRPTMDEASLAPLVSNKDEEGYKGDDELSNNGDAYHKEIVTLVQTWSIGKATAKEYGQGNRRRPLLDPNAPAKVMAVQKCHELLGTSNQGDNICIDDEDSGGFDNNRRQLLNFTLRETYRHWFCQSYKVHCWQRIDILSPLCKAFQDNNGQTSSQKDYLQKQRQVAYHLIHTVLLTFVWRNQGWPYHESAVYILEDEKEKDDAGGDISRSEASTDNQEQKQAIPQQPPSISRRQFSTPSVGKRIVSRAHVRTKKHSNFVKGKLTIHHPQPDKTYRMWFQIGGGKQLEIRHLTMEYLLYNT